MDSTTVQGDWYSVVSPVNLFITCKADLDRGVLQGVLQCTERRPITCADCFSSAVDANSVKLAAAINNTTPLISTMHPTRCIACVSKGFVQESQYATKP